MSQSSPVISYTHTRYYKDFHLADITEKKINKAMQDAVHLVINIRRQL